MPHLTENQKKLLEMDPSYVTRVANIEFRVVRAGEKKWVVGAIQHLRSSGRQIIIDLRIEENAGNAYDTWQELVREEIELRHDAPVIALKAS